MLTMELVSRYIGDPGTSGLCSGKESVEGTLCKVNLK